MIIVHLSFGVKDGKSIIFKKFQVKYTVKNGLWTGIRVILLQ